MSGILVYALHYEGAFNKNSLGAVSEGARLASELGTECHAIVVGDKAGLPDDLCASLGSYGASKVHRVEGPEGLAQPVVDAMAKVIADNDLGYALFGGGLLGFEIGAGLTARLDAGVCMEVTNVRVEDGKLVAERPILGDSQVSDVHYNAGVGVIIGRLNAFEATQSGESAATVEDVDVEFAPHSLKARMVTRGEQRGADVNIEDADILVAGGRGLGKAEGFQTLEELANALGGAVPPPARSSMPAGTPTAPRSARRARPSRPSSTSRRASPARSSTRSACRAPRTSSPSTRTRTPRSSSSPTSASSAT